jgi:Tfp pilus assembly protein PilV
MPNKRRAQTGFAIVEVLVATVVLSIGFLELARAFRNINSVAVQAVAMTKASNLAHATMERVMAQNFDARGNDLEFGDYALNFDGGNDHVVIADNPSLDFGSGTSFSISFWSNPSTWVQEGKYILDKTDGSVGYSISITTNLRLQFSIAAVDVYTASNALNGLENEWHQFEITCNRSGNAQWYIDSSTSGSATSISGAGNIDNGSSLTIGSDNTPGNYFNGKIDEVRIWNDLRTADEIKASYNRSLSDPYEETNLKLYLRMNNDPGTVAFDHSSNMAHGTINGATYTSGSISWTSNSNLGNDGEAVDWSTNNDVDDFYKTGPDSPLLDDGFSGLGRRIYVKYVSVSGSSPSYSFSDSGTPTNYKQITVKVGIPGTTDSTKLDAIKAAKVNQGYSLIFSPYGN